MASPINIIHLIVTALAAGVLFFSICKRQLPKATYFIFCSLFIFLHSLGYLLELTGTGPDLALAGVRLQYAALPFLAVFFFLFTLEFFNRAFRNRLAAGLMLAYPAASALLLLSNALNGMYFAEATYDAAGAGAILVRRGPLAVAALWYSALFLLLGLLVVGFNAFSRNPGLRRPAITLVAVLLLPGLLWIAHIFQLRIMAYNPGSAIMVLAELVLVYYILRFCMDDWMPLARESVLEHIDDAFVLLDTENRFLDANAVAARYFPDIQKTACGVPIEQVRGFPLGVLQGNGATEEFTLQRGGETLYLRASRSVVSRGRKTVCTCVMIYDITAIRLLMNELNLLATRDGLTGLYNRNTFFSLAGRDYDLAKRNGTTATLMMVDIDLFKRVNDRYGHQCGDEALMAVARLLAESLRRTDIIGRYGGEEFCLLLPGTAAGGAAITAEKLRQAVEGLWLECNGHRFSVTVSIGVAVYDAGRHGCLDALVNEADGALYRAKNEGRNRVLFA